VLDTIEALGCGYVAKFKMTRRVAARISKIRKWAPSATVYSLPAFIISPWAGSAPEFVIIERNEVPKKDPVQLQLFDFNAGPYGSHLDQQASSRKCLGLLQTRVR